MRRLVLAALFFALPAAVTAQDAETLAHRALVAGYKAAFTCSATFNAARSADLVALNELSGIYPGYRETLASLPKAEIASAPDHVTVAYADDLAPRIAVYRPGYGCTQLPVGAGLDAAEWLPSRDTWLPDEGLDRSSAIGSDAAVTLPVDLQAALEAPVSFAFDGATYGEGTRTSAVIVVRGGEIVAEDYARGVTPETPQRTWSVAKSISATILGAAEQDGLIGRQSSALIETWHGGADPRRAITLTNLLHMASGLDSGAQGSRTDAVYFGGARVVDEAVTAPLQVPPGSRFRYANNDTLIAMRSLREAIGDIGAYHDYPYTALLWKIGMRRTTLEVDWNGDFVSSSQVWTTARDLARLGQLYLQDGRWGDEQILPADWAEFVATPAPAQPESGTFGYGAQFWLLNQERGVPSDSYAAAGHRGQYLVIIPSRDLVLVRRGYDESGATRFDIAGFTRDVVAAVEAADARAAEGSALASALENGEAERRADGTVEWLQRKAVPLEAQGR